MRAGWVSQSKHGDSHRSLSAEEADVATGESEMLADDGEPPQSKHGDSHRPPSATRRFQGVKMAVTVIAEIVL